MSTVHRIALASILALLLLGTGCAVKYDDDYTPPPPESTITAEGTVLPSAPPADLPPEPDEQERAAYLDALSDENPALLSPGEDEAVARGREICRMIVQTESMENPDETRQRRARELFGTTEHAVQEAEAQTILTASRTHICPDL